MYSDSEFDDEPVSKHPRLSRNCGSSRSASSKGSQSEEDSDLCKNTVDGCDEIDGAQNGIDKSEEAGTKCNQKGTNSDGSNLKYITMSSSKNKQMTPEFSPSSPSGDSSIFTK